MSVFKSFINKRNSKYTIIAITLIAIIIFYVSVINKQAYGNDKESIIEVIQSIDGYNSELIEILEIKDIYNNRIVSFLLHDSPAFIQFYKNSAGNYEWNHVEKKEGKSFAEFIPNLRDEKSDVLRMLIVSNQYNEIAQMELSVNERIFKEEFDVNQSNVSWINIAKTNGDEDSLRFDFKYFDVDGNPIQEGFE
ncbi:MAG: hypothetical protein R3328_06900 [Planococcaceae bacterium]|nr:hypothetical protein [Planococcaceae bacterium]